MSEKILLIAPHPFYQERGTPIAVDLLIRALTERGYLIDLLTFNEGIDVQHPGLTIHRVKPFPDIKNVMPGFSGKKIALDVLIFFKFIALMTKNNYKVVHAVEESSFMATLICPLYKTPFIYDMDSSMATQILDKMPFLKPFAKVIRLMESIPMRRAKIVIPVCQALADEAGKYRSQGIHVLKDVSLANNASADDDEAINIRDRYTIDGKILMYIGNLESYQGIDLMLDAFAIYSPQHPDAHLIIIGGEQKHIDFYQSRCQQLSIQNTVVFMGKQPVSQINQFMSQANILLSPRTQGVNTPMKVYSYLDSNVAVLATDLPTHTQVADSSTAYLCPAEAKAYAAGMETLSSDSELCVQLAKNASQLIAREHSYPVFRARLYAIYDELPARQQ